MSVGARRRIEYQTDGKGKTLFAIFRSLFWERAKEELGRRGVSTDPEDVRRSRALERILGEPLKADVVVLLSLLPFTEMPSFSALSRSIDRGVVPDGRSELHAMRGSFGYELANG